MKKFKGKQITVIECHEWDALVRETYKRMYCFQQQDGCKERQLVEFTVPPEYVEDYKNDSVPEVVNGEQMGVSFKAWLARDPEQKLNTEVHWDREYGLNLFWERNFYPDLTVLVQDLYEKGILEEGSYAINIDW